MANRLARDESYPVGMLISLLKPLGNSLFAWIAVKDGGNLRR
jgi:hypothetical protein